MFARPAYPAEAVSTGLALAPEAPVKRSSARSPGNWPVRWKVFAIVLVPLVLATVLGILRIQGAMADAGGLRVAAARADVLPAITKYMAALDVALLASSTDRDVEGAKKNYAARRHELQQRLADTDVASEVRTGVNNLLSGGQSLLDKVADNSIGLRDRVTTYAPILLTAEDVINASVQVDDGRIRAQAEGLSRAVGARGQMTMQKIFVTRGADLPEPQLRTSMITLAGTEPSTLFGMSQVLGASSPESKTLQQQMMTRMAILSDPAVLLVDNPDLLRSIQTTDDIAEKVVQESTASVTKSVQARADDRRNAAILVTVLVLTAIVVALVVVLVVARALVRPLRVLRDGALKVAHTDLEDEVARVRAGEAAPTPEPVPVYTTEEIGQVAHAVDELHNRALLLAGDEARLRLLVNDMFETMSRRSRSLVDQQLSLIDRLERNEEDPERLDSLFRLDHLAARLRRNSANLLVLAGAQLARDQRDPVPLSTVVNAAVSEVEDYRRVDIVELPDCALVGAVAGGVIHLFAELIDNALRYSPPETSVRIFATRGGPGDSGGILLRISDSGLGMSDADRRIANMRLQSGGEVTPDSARHMGLFVVGRIAARHGIRVGLRGPAAGEAGSGTSAEIYLPPTVIEGLEPSAEPRADRVRAVTSTSAQLAQLAGALTAPAPAGRHEPEPVNQNGPAGSAPSVTLLPRRKPGSSGITEVPAPPAEQQPRRPRRELPTPWWETGQQTPQSTGAPEPKPAPAPAASDTSAFFAARARSASPSADDRALNAVQGADDRPQTPAPKPAGASDPATPTVPKGSTPPGDSADDDVIYRSMLSEMLVDPHDLVNTPDLDWQSVWDHGWSLAAEAEEKPVESRTAGHGLPVRKPGERLVPGGASATGFTERGDCDPQSRESNGRQAQPAAAGPLARDPEAVRASFSSHFDGVRTGRSRARDTVEGAEQQ